MRTRTRRLVVGTLALLTAATALPAAAPQQHEQSGQHGQRRPSHHGCPPSSATGRRAVVRGGERIPVPGGSGRLGVFNVLEPAWDAANGGYTEVPFGSSHLQAVGFDGGRCPGGPHPAVVLLTDVHTGRVRPSQYGSRNRRL